MDTITIKIDTNAANAGKTFEDLNKKLKDTTQQSEDLRKQIKGLKDELYRLEPGTEEYARVLGELGGKMDQLQETTQQLRAATGSLDTVFQTTVSAIGSLASGFSAAQGVVALFGVESEDLQKTFVKLQAVMAIATGLKGFAGFGKEVKKASISLKTFISQSILATKSTIAQTTATSTLAATEGVATVSTNIFKKAWQGLTAAMASNPIGAVLVALTALATTIALVASNTKKASDNQATYNDIISGAKVSAEQYTSLIKARDKADERYIARMKLLGETEEEINEQRRIDARNNLKDAQQTVANLEEELKLRRKVVSQAGAAGFFMRLSGYISDVTDALKEANAEVKKWEENLKDMEASTAPAWFYNFENDLDELSDKFRVDIAAGSKDRGDYIRAQIKAYSDALADLNEKMQSVTDAQEFSDMIIVSDVWEKKIKQLEVDLAEYNAGLAKKAADDAKRAAEALNKNFKKVSKDISDKADEYQEAWNKALRKFADLGKYAENDTLVANQSLGRAITEMNRYSMQLDEYVKEWLKNAQKALDAGEITQSQYNKLKKHIEDTQAGMISSMQDELNVFMTEGFYNAGKKIQGISEGFKKQNEDMLAALAGGLVTKEEYHSFLLNRLNEYRQEIDKEMPAALEELENSLREAVANGKNEEEYRQIYEEYLKVAKDIIPPSVMQQINTSLKEIIDKEFDEMSKEYSNKMKEFQAEVQKAAYGWMYGTYGDNSTLESGESLMMKLLFGQGEDPKVAYDRARAEAQRWFDIIKEEADAEIALLQERMSLLDQNSDQYQAYADKIEGIQANLATAQQELEEKQLQNAQDYADKIYDIASSTMDALGGLASAMGSYYGEQKERAKEMYGENSEEYQKYLKKEGAMKIAEVWANWATGVMAAWAANAKYGVASYILAALQTAALTATAIASTQQINRSTKANSSGGASTANVSGLTDRVIMAEAQNTDQTAQLNADYNQGAQRVFVTVDDINSGQDANRTAVTNNRF